MNHCYNVALKMPSNYALMNAEEMTYAEGGENIGMTRDYLDKSYCESLAQSYVDKGWTNVTVDQLKKEIYGHAFGYYKMTPAVLIAGGAALSLAWTAFIYPHLKDGVDIENKVDKYQFAWDILWNF